MPDFIALRGDPSDGLPGAKGIGEKTAADAAAAPRDAGGRDRERAIREKPGVRKALIGQADELRMFKDVATLRRMDLERPADALTDGRAVPMPPLSSACAGSAERLRALPSGPPSSSSPPARTPDASPAVSPSSPCSRSSRWPLRPRAPSAVPARRRSAPALEHGLGDRLRPGNVGRRGGYKTGRWDQDWRDVEVPHVFNAKPVDDQFLGTIAWYRLKLTTPATPAGFGWALRFEGVRRRATVYLNGRRIGGSEGLRAVHDPAAAAARGRARRTSSWCGSPTCARRTCARAGGTGAG